MKLLSLSGSLFCAAMLLSGNLLSAAPLGNYSSRAILTTPAAIAITTGLPAAPAGYEYRTFRVTDAQSANPKAFIQAVAAPAP